MAKAKTELTERCAAEYVRQGGNMVATARALGMPRGTVQHHVKKMGLNQRPIVQGKTAPTRAEGRQLPEVGEVRRYILTCAQNNTKVFEPLWQNLQALKEHYDAELLVGSFSYNRKSYGELAVKRGTKSKGRKENGPDDTLWFDERIERYLDASDRRIQLAPGLVWCGEMNILPTAARPLSGLQAYTGLDSGIFPHVKVAMESIATGPDQPAKFNYTTGTVTKLNYIQKKEGLKAEFHHVYGALLVEVDEDGAWWARQLIADKKGAICDLDVSVSDGVVTTGNSIAGITWGDIHNASLDKQVYDIQWGTGGMLDTLQPGHQFMHDTVDGRSFNPHITGQHHWHDLFREHVKGNVVVEEELDAALLFLDASRRPFCKTVVVNSNHDNFLLRWLEREDYRRDPTNAVFFLEAQAHVYRSIEKAPDRHVNMLRWLAQRNRPSLLSGSNPVVFLDEDESFKLFDIENGSHGDLGPNGAYGSPSVFAKMAVKMNRGHEHSAGIYDGIYTAGVTGRLHQGYNRGPSSWSHSHILTYANRKRAIVTLTNGRPWAAR